MSKNVYIESLLALGGKKKAKSIDYITNELLIRHKDSRIEYTVIKVFLDDNGKPSVLCYRYYMPNKNKNKKKVYIKIKASDFNKYEPVWEINEIFNKQWYKKNHQRNFKN